MVTTYPTNERAVRERLDFRSRYRWTGPRGYGGMPVLPEHLPSAEDGSGHERRRRRQRRDSQYQPMSEEHRRRRFPYLYENPHPPTKSWSTMPAQDPTGAKLARGLRAAGRVGAATLPRLNPYVRYFELAADIGQLSAPLLREALRALRGVGTDAGGEVDWLPVTIVTEGSGSGEVDFVGAGWNTSGGWDFPPSLGTGESIVGPMELVHDGETVGFMVDIAAHGWTPFTTFTDATWDIDGYESVYQAWPVANSFLGLDGHKINGNSYAYGYQGEVSDPFPATGTSVTRPLPLWAFPTPGRARRGNAITEPWGVGHVSPWHSYDSAWPMVDMQPFPFPIGWPWPITTTDPVPQPATQVVQVPEFGAPTVTIVPGRPINQSPSRPRRRGLPGQRTRIKERKVRLRGLWAAVWVVMGQITEVFDFIEVLHKALPKHLRAKRTPGRRLTPSEMAEAVWRNFDALDLAAAVEGYINNQIEDFIYGTLSPSKGINQATGKPTGGGASFGRLTHTGQQSGEAISELIPQIEFDVHTGAWKLDFAGYSWGGNVRQRRR